MKTFIVTRRRGHGLAEYSPDLAFPVYRVVAPSSMEAKKIACRLDKQNEMFCNLYIATPAKEKRRPAATGRRVSAPITGTNNMKTKNNISHHPKIIKGGKWL